MWRPVTRLPWKSELPRGTTQTRMSHAVLYRYHDGSTLTIPRDLPHSDTLRRVWAAMPPRRNR